MSTGTVVRTFMPWVLLFVLALLMSFQDIRTFDYWWHLRTGALIAETGEVPKVDPYTYTVPGNPWIDIHWLHQLGIHGLYTLGGHAAVVVAKGVVMCGLIAILASVGGRRRRPLTSVIPLALMLLVSADRIMPRPELPTFLCLAGVLVLLDRYQRKPDKWVYAVIPIQMIWVNVHGLFAVGIAVCAIHVAAEVVRPLVAPEQRFRRDRVWTLAIVTALAALVSLVNPNGLEGAIYPVQQLGMIGPPEERGIFGSLIAELTPPLAGETPFLGPMGWIFASLVLWSFSAMTLNWRRITSSDPLIWVAFLYLALSAQRNVALFAIAAAPIAIRNLNEWLDARPSAATVGGAWRWAATGVTSAALLVCSAGAVNGELFLRGGLARSFGFGVMDVFYPMGAAEWIAQERPPGRILHHMADGGYLIWRLHPDYLVMVDGRLEVFGPERFIELQVPGLTRFRALDAEYHFGSILIHYSLIPSAELMWWLYLNTNWRLSYLDDVAVVFTRVPEGAPPGDAVDLDAPDLFPPLEAVGAVDRMQRFARTNFWTSMRRWKRALSLWEETRERYPNIEQGPIIHAMLLDKNGLQAASEAILRELMIERPEDAELLTHVGDLRLGAGDLDAARELYEAALTMEPNQVHALTRRAQVAESDGDPALAVDLYLRVTGLSHPATPLAMIARSRLLALSGVSTGGR
jgi:hypothetical protein